MVLGNPVKGSNHLLTLWFVKPPPTLEIATHRLRISVLEACESQGFPESN